jgi:hypothetical protein
MLMQERRRITPSGKSKTKKPVQTRKNRAPKAIWQIAEECSALAPLEEWRKLPSDLSKRFDEYHYGRQQAEN